MNNSELRVVTKIVEPDRRVIVRMHELKKGDRFFLDFLGPLVATGDPFRNRDGVWTIDAVTMGQRILHPFQPRVVHKNGEKQATLLSDECGFCINEHINSTSFGPDYCGRPKSEHLS